MSLLRLDSMRPETAELFRRATPWARQQAALLACTESLSETQLSGDLIDQALMSLRLHQVASLDVLAQLEALAQQFDDRYFALEESSIGSRTDEAIVMFSRARAISALLFALRGKSDDLHEAIYEALSALEEPSRLAATVDRVLAQENS